MQQGCDPMKNAICPRNPEQADVITLAERRKCFPGLGVVQIRDLLEAQGLDRHMQIETESTEIVLKTPAGIIMQVRADFQNQLCLWGGELKPSELPLVGAQRELNEETRLFIDADSFQYLEVHDHKTVYGNGDKCLYHTYRYLVELNYVPEIIIDNESAGFVFVTNAIIADQYDIVKKVLHPDAE